MLKLILDLVEEMLGWGWGGRLWVSVRVREKLNMKDACDTCLCERNRMFWTASPRLFMLSPAVDADSSALPPLPSSPPRSPCGTNPRRRPEEVSVPSHRSAPSSVI